MIWLLLLAMVIGGLIGYFFCCWQVNRDEDLVYINNVRGLKCCKHGGVGYQLKRTPPSGMLDPYIDGVPQKPEMGSQSTTTLNDAIKFASPRVLAECFCDHVRNDSVLRSKLNHGQLLYLFLDAEPWRLNLVNGRDAILKRFGEKTGAGREDMRSAKTDIYNALIAVCSAYSKAVPQSA